jgi:hypothetical protein
MDCSCKFPSELIAVSLRPAPAGPAGPVCNEFSNPRARGIPARVHGKGRLYTIGRQANGDLLNLESAGLNSEGRGKLSVNEHFQTTVPHIYAAGDAIGFPALASTSMEQGRLASCHMFGKPGKMPPNLIPYGIYTIPEISMVGQTEEQLTKENINYEVGLARYAELAKGQMLGDDQGLLKLVFDPDSLKLLGVHAIGDRAAEIHSHRPGRSHPGSKYRIFSRCGVQLSHSGGNLQGCCARWIEQAVASARRIIRARWTARKAIRRSHLFGGNLQNEWRGRRDSNPRPLP